MQQSATVPWKPVPWRLVLRKREPRKPEPAGAWEPVGPAPVSARPPVVAMAAAPVGHARSPCDPTEAEPDECEAAERRSPVPVHPDVHRRAHVHAGMPPVPRRDPDVALPPRTACRPAYRADCGANSGDTWEGTPDRRTYPHDAPGQERFQTDPFRRSTRNSGRRAGHHRLGGGITAWEGGSPGRIARIVRCRGAGESRMVTG